MSHSPSRIVAFRHTILATMVALLFYVGICLFAFQYMDERNGVTSGKRIPNTDHWPVARQLMIDRNLTNFRYPPGFSLYIISAVQAVEKWGGSYFFWRMVQDCFSAAVTVALIMALMVQLTNSVWVGCGANLLLIYNLTYSAGTSSDLAMTSFMPWFFGSLHLLTLAIQRSRERVKVQALLAGILLAISGFIRPDILLFLPFIAFVLWSFQRLSRLRNAYIIPFVQYPLCHTLCISLLGFSIVALPWIAYASARSGSIVLYSTGFASSHIDGMGRFPGNPVSEAFKNHSIELTSMVDLAKMHYSLLKEYPKDWLQLWVEKLWRPWYASDSQRWDLLLMIQTLLIVPPILVSIYLWLWKRGLDLGFTIAFSVIGYFWLITLSVLSINRYMPPIYPFLGMFIGFAVQVLWSTKRGRVPGECG